MRLNLFGNPVAAKFLKYINLAGQVVSGSTASSTWAAAG
jgi:hypothetical protein